MLKKLTMKNLRAKTNRIFFYTILAVLVLTGCKRSSNKTDAVAIVDGKEISSKDYSKELKFYQSYYSKLYGDNYLSEKNKNGLTNDETLRKELLDSMIKDKIMLSDLEKNKIKLDDNNVIKLTNDLKKSMNGEDSLGANVDALNANGNLFNEIIFNDAIRKSHYEMFVSKQSVRDSDVLDFYKKNNKYQKMYKYNLIVFDDENEAKNIKKNITNAEKFNEYINKSVRNYDIVNSEFVYSDDEVLKASKLTEKNRPSDVFKYNDKYIIAMINSYNENENELLMNAKSVYQKKAYEDYLNKLIKSSKIKVYI